MNDEEREVVVAQIEEALALPSEMARDFAGFVADTALAGVWSRPGLAARERSLITIAALTALDRANELRIHMGLGLDNGLTREEIGEVVMHMAVYGGFPVAVEGMRIAKEVFEDRDSD